MNVEALAQRVQLLEDRAAIIDVVVRYAAAIDEADWDTFGALLTDPVHVDFSQAGLPAADLGRDEFAGFAAKSLEVYDARQHLSTNHRVTVTGDTAVCHSYMYAQHHRAGAPVYLMRGWYDHHLVRTDDGWRVGRVVQHVSWLEGTPA